MRINREKLKELAAKPDRELWTEICATAKKYGYTLPTETPPPDRMAQLRDIMNGREKIGMSEALKILSSYKNKK